MSVEIERKFLVTGTQWRTGHGTMLVQGNSSLAMHPYSTWSERRHGAADAQS